MLTIKERIFELHGQLSLERLVPDDQFYRHLETTLDLSFVRDLVKDYYSPLGRPSIDPVVYFKLQLIMFFEDIRSERKLMETVALNLAHRWYLGYDLAEKLPHHSSLTKIRQRYGVVVFQKFFERVVDLCQETGLIWGEEVYFDGSLVRANADKDHQVPRFYWDAQQENRVTQQVEQKSAKLTSGLSFIMDAYQDAQIAGARSSSYQRKSDRWFNPVDPHATPLRKQHRLGYTLHYLVDGGRSRIILASLVTPASVGDHAPMLDLVRWTRFRFKLKFKIGVGDTRYGTAANIAGLEKEGIQAYLPRTDYTARQKTFRVEWFTYDPVTDCYICPRGYELQRLTIERRDQVIYYAGDVQRCQTCRAKDCCTISKYARKIRRSLFQEYLDLAQSYRSTEPYLKAMRKRQVWVEPLFAEAKEWHGLHRFRLRKLPNVNIQAVMTATGQNLKRLLAAQGWGKRWFPSGNSSALDFPNTFLFALCQFALLWQLLGLLNLNEWQFKPDFN